VQQKSLFREEVVDKMLSPDDLDRLMRVVDPKGWLALIGLLALVVPAAVWGIFGSIPTQVTADDGILIHRDALHEVVSQTSGIVTDVSVKTGDDVQQGQVVVHVRTEAGAEVNVVSLFTGRVVDVAIDKGMFLDRGQQVAVVEVANKPLEGVFFVPAEQGKQLENGMQVHVSPSTASAEAFGYLQGTVSSVSQFPVTEGDMLRLLENQSLVDALRVEKDQLEVSVELLADPSTPSGFKWSSSQGPPFPLTHATPCTATFVLGEQHPVDLIFPDGTEG
jgi:multidrug efflux pump subunit AcrA (membrane-fusion protein)